MEILQNSLKAVTATLLLSMIALISYSQSGLIGLWHLDGNTNDASGNGHNGTIVGTVTQTTGQCNQGYNFDGNSWINYGNVDVTGTFSVSVWVKSNDPYQTEVWRNVVTKLDNPAGGPFELFVDDGRENNITGSANVLVWNGGVSTCNVIAPFDMTKRAKDGNWHHLAFTYQSGQQLVYFDGVQVASNTCVITLPNPNAEFHIGGVFFGSFHKPWVGDIDEVALYNRVLSAAEVQALAQGCSSTCGNATSTSVTNITSNSATLNWVASVNPARWQIQYRVKGATSWNNIKPAGSARSANITGLLPNRRYNWHIRARCNGVWTSYSVVKGFNTLASAQSAQISMSEKDKSGVLSVYPNPARGQFVIDLSITDHTATVAKMDLINMTGQTAHSESAGISNGRLQKTVLIPASVPGGTYIVRVIVNSKAYTATLVYEK